MLKSLLQLAWRNFTRNKVSSFINVLGLAIGMGVTILNGLWIRDEWSFNKVHQHYEPVKPTFFFIKSLNGGVNTINIKIAHHTPPAAALSKIQAVFRRLIPSAPFDYKFIDEAYGRKFAAEERIGKLAAFFGSLAIFISCLGLFGLASFVAEQRTREIGIRKVLGATVFHVWQLLSKEFVQLVLLSCLLAVPAAWYFMHAWLQGYTYRAPISWWVFAAAAIGALLVTLFTVSTQSIRAALKNPVKSLKME